MEKKSKSLQFLQMFAELANQGRRFRLSVRKHPKTWWSDLRIFESNPKPRKVTRQLRKQVDAVIADLRAKNTGKPKHAQACIKHKQVRSMLRYNTTAM